MIYRRQLLTERTFELYKYSEEILKYAKNCIIQDGEIKEILFNKKNNVMVIYLRHYSIVCHKQIENYNYQNYHFVHYTEDGTMYDLLIKNHDFK